MDELAEGRQASSDAPRAEAPSLAEVYPAGTLAAIDRRGRSRSAEMAGRRDRSGVAGRLATGGLVAGLLLGVRDALEVEPDRPEVIDVDLDGIAEAEGVRLLLVRDAPELSRAWVSAPEG